jgi:tape measure domain-containing protein
MATLSNNDIKIRYVVETSNLEAAAQAFDKLSVEEKQALAELKKFNQESQNTNKSFGELGSIAGKVGGVLGGLFAVGQIKQFASAVVETTIKFEAMRKAIDFASGSAEMGNKNFEFVRQTAQKLGLDLRGAVEGYKTFASASNLAGQSSQETNRQFAAVAKAAQVMGLSAEDTKGAFLALGQMMSKGNVQAEELRGQLGERLVGAFGIAAKAMGVTTGELNKMLQKGQVLAADFLPKFATELENTFGKGNTQVTSLAASQNRFNSSIDQLILAIGNKLNPFLKGAYDLAAGIATELAKAGGETSAEKQAKFNAEAVAQKRIETELTRETIKLDQQRIVKITAANLDDIRKKIALNQLLGIESRIEAQLLKVSEARIAAAGTMSSRLQMNLTKQENELKILQAMEEQYSKIAGVIINTPPPPAPIDPKEIKKEYEQRLNILELLKQMRILEGELRNDPLARLGAEKAFLEAKLKLQKQYNQLFIKEEIEVTKLQVDVASKEFETGASRQLIILKEANVKVLEEDKNLYDKRLAEMKKWQKAYEQSLDDEAKKRKEAEDEKQRRIQATIELASTLTNGFTNLYTARIDNEITALNRRAEEEIRLADGNQQKIDEINQRTAEKERELKMKAWKAEQTAAVARVIFETASIVAKWSSNPVTLPLAALTLFNQAAQIGFIMSQPVPEFAEGTKGQPFKGGKAIVGERGVEKVVTESGRVYFTPPTATLVDLPKGSQVIPNHALSKQELFLANHYANRSSSGSPVVGKLDELSGILKSLPITQLNMDERGFEKFIRTPRRTTKILNNRFRSSSS